MANGLRQIPWEEVGTEQLLCQAQRYCAGIQLQEVRHSAVLVVHLFHRQRRFQEEAR